MKLRHKYLMIGAVWALVAGLAGGAATVAYALGASWLWVYGDDTWPEYVSWLIPLTGVAVGGGAALAVLAFAWRHGRTREAMAPQKGEGWRLAGLTAAPLVLLVAGGMLVWVQGNRIAEARAMEAYAQAQFRALAAATHRITAVDMRGNLNGRVRASVVLKGGRSGDYRLGWRVRDSGTGTALIDGSRVISLSAGEHVMGMGFELGEIAALYRDEILKGGGGVLVEEPFRLEVSLAPEPNGIEVEMLPQAERYALENGLSDLQSTEEASFPVRFTIARDGTISE